VKPVSRLGLLAALAAALAWLGWWLWGEVQGPAEVPLETEVTVAAQPTPGELAGAVKRASSTDKPPLARTTAAEPIPGGDGALLSLIVLDPLGLLEHPHELQILAGNRAFIADWLQDGNLFITRLAVSTAPPKSVAFGLLPLFPLDFIAGTAEVSPTEDGNYQATLDLSQCAAIVELVVIGPAERLRACSLKAKFRPLGGKDGTLDLTEDARETLTVIAPVPCGIEAELKLESGQGFHRTLIPIFEAGRFRREITLPSGSLRVIAAPRAVPSNRPDIKHTLQLEPANALGGGFLSRLVPCEPGSEVLIELLPPGVYQLRWRDNAPRWKVLANLTVVIGNGETVLELSAPGSDRSLTLQFAPGETTYFNLYRAGTNYGPEQSLTARPNGSQVTFRNLDAAEWIVTARRGTQASHLRVDTRRSFDSEAEVPGWAELTQVQIELAPSLPQGDFYVQIHEPSGFVWQRFINSRHGWTWEYATHQGLMRIEAIHHTGLVAEALVVVPGPGAQPVILVAPLNFRAP